MNGIVYLFTSIVSFYFSLFMTFYYGTSFCYFFLLDVTSKQLFNHDQYYSLSLYFFQFHDLYRSFFFFYKVLQKACLQFLLEISLLMNPRTIYVWDVSVSQITYSFTTVPSDIVIIILAIFVLED